MKRQAKPEQPDRQTVPTMQLIAALNSACKDDAHETASQQLTDELEDAGSLAKRQAQHKRAAAYWTRQRLAAAWKAIKTGCTRLKSPGTPDTCYAVAAAECEAAQKKLAATIRMVQDVLSTRSAKEVKRAAYMKLAATFTMVQVRHTVKYIHA